MKAFEQNKNLHLHSLNASDQGIGPKRLVWEGQAPEKQPEAQKPAEAAPIVDLNLYKFETAYKEKREDTLNDLAQKDKVLGRNFEEAIKETLTKAGYDKNIDAFWKELKDKYACDKVKVEGGKIHFMKGTVEVAPNFSVVPVAPDLSRFRTDMPRTKYYDPGSGMVNLKGWKETREITVRDLVLNASNGTKIKVTPAGSKKAREAVFIEDGQKAKYTDGKKEVVKIFDGYKVELVRAEPTTPAILDQAESAWGKYPTVGEFKYTPRYESSVGSALRGEGVLNREGLSAEDYIRIALGEKKDDNKVLDSNNPNLQKLRQLFEQKLYTFEEYQKFLKDNKAIQADRIMLLIDPQALARLDEAAKRKEEGTKKTEYTNQLTATQTRERQKFMIPGNLSEDVAFSITDQKLLELIGDEYKWKKAWDNDSIEGITVLKGIIASEPDIFGNVNPNSIRDRLRNAISNSRNDRIYFSDLLDDVLDTRFPSFSQDKAGDKKVTDVMSKQGNFLSWYGQMKDNQKDLDQIQKAHGLLTCLGRNTLETATVVKSEKDVLTLNIIFDNKAYTIKVNQGGAIGGEETVKFYHFNTNNLLPNQGSFENGLRYKTGSLDTEDEAQRARVQTEVRDALSPRMTYSRFMEVYNENFNKDGSPKNPNMDREWINRMQNIIIGGNRFLLQVQNLKYNEKSTGEMGRVNFQQNRSGEVNNEEFLKIVGDDDLWAKEWNNPTLDNVKQIKRIFQEEPVLREIAKYYPTEIGKRVQDAITTGKNRLLYADDVIDYVLKGLPMQPSATEKEPLVTIDGSSGFREHYNNLFDSQGNPKAGVEPAVAERYKAVMRACNKLLVAFEGGKESVSETSETTAVSQLLRNANVKEKDYNFTKFYSADDIYNNYQAEQIYSVPARSELANGVGLQINDQIFGPQYEKIVAANKHAVFKAILQTYPLPQLINQGNISRASKKSSSTEVYVIDNVPDSFKAYITGMAGGKSVLETLIANKADLTTSGVAETLNPQNKLHRVAEFIFPLKKSARSYEDVAAGEGKTIEQDRIYNRLDYTFAHTQFLKSCTVDGNITSNIDEAKMLGTLNSYLELFDARLNLQYGPKDAPRIRQEFLSAFGGVIPKMNMALLESVAQDPDKSKVLLGAIHDGFMFSHENKISKQRQDAVDTLKTNYDKWKKSISPEELALLEKALREQMKLPENQIPVAIEHMLPIWFGLGVDTATGTVGVGAGVGVPLRLVFDGVNYGTITIGGGLTVGATGIGQERGVRAGVGIGGGMAYKTPNLGPFALFAGVAGGVGIDSQGTVGAGWGVGGGVSIEWGTVGATKISSDVGIAYVPGVPFPLPGLTITFSKDHEASLRNLRADMHEKFGLSNIETQLKGATTDAQRKAIIGQNEFFKTSYNRGYQPGFDQAKPENVVRAYESYKAALEDALRQDYDPSLFWGITSLTIGFGFTTDKDTGEKKFIFLVGGSLATGQEVKSYAYEGKNAAVMNQEIQVAHWKELIDRNSQGKLSDSEKSEVQQLISSGKLLARPGSKDLAIFVNNETPAGTPVTINTTETPAGDLIATIEKQFNEKLSPPPLNLRVKYNPGNKLYELLFNNWDDRTNYDIAVDHRMKTGGIVVDGGHIYLASTFEPGSNLTILRSDYEYPFEQSGKNYHTVITLSDSPLTPAHEIYNASSEILSSRGGIWYPQHGLGFDQYAKQEPSRFFSNNVAGYYAFNPEKYKQKDAGSAPDDENTQRNINTLSVTPSEKGTVDEKAIIDFSKAFLRKFPLDYRKRSNRETTSNQFGDLNDMIVKEWKKSHQDKEPSPAELNEIRLKIMDESFSELGNIKNPRERELAFRNRLDRTIDFIIKPRFQLLIDRNHQKYPKTDPRYIRNSVEDLTRTIILRVRNIDVNSEANSVLLRDIDRTSTVAGTLNILGFRGNAYGADNADPNQKMIGAGPNYADALRNSPNGYEADIARLILEETSTLPAATGITPETPSSQIDKTKAYDLLRADLSQKIISTLFTPLSRGLFSPGVREEILRLAATKDNLSFTEGSSKALYELQNLVEGIRLAEVSGEAYYIPKNNPDYRFKLNLEVKDGMYKKCTNYSMWINEGLDLQMRTSKITRGPELAAAYGVSTGTTQTKSGMEFTSINIAAVVAVTTKPEAPPPPPPETPTTEGTGGGRVGQRTGGARGGAINKPAAPQAPGGGPAGPETAPPGTAAPSLRTRIQGPSIRRQLRTDTTKNNNGTASPPTDPNNNPI
jgi:hypothetical protein